MAWCLCNQKGTHNGAHYATLKSMVAGVVGCSLLPLHCTSFVSCARVWCRVIDCSSLTFYG